MCETEHTQSKTQHTESMRSTYRRFPLFEHTKSKKPNKRTIILHLKPNIQTIILRLKSNIPNIRYQAYRQFLAFETELTHNFYVENRTY